MAKLVSQVVKIGEFQVLQAEVKELRDLVESLTEVSVLGAPAATDTPAEAPTEEASAELTTEGVNAKDFGEQAPATVKGKKGGKGKAGNV